MPPRRSTTRASYILDAPPPSLPPAQPNPEADDLTILRKQWKWAAFSQFYCTFFPLFSLNDVLVVDIERDLVHCTNVTIPRVMQKLLFTLSYDRKISVDNWQNALRKQYLKRDPDANPLGSEPEKTRHSTKELDEPIEPFEQMDVKDDDPEQPNGNSERDKPTADEMDTNPDTPATETDPKVDPSTRQSSAVPKDAASDIKEETAPPQAAEDSKLVDWFDLPILTKLETLHTLSEWQFQNPTRLRTVMKSDDELASWRIEPIGYDTKRNAYWYIGDRLWIQRERPKAPRTKALKRKRAPEKSTRETPKSASTPAKRARIAAPAAAPSPSPASGRHSRAAKDQAKLKLDEQARELAELNRQANMSSSSRPTRQSSRTQSAVKTAPAPPPRPAGTRISARLRGPQQDDEWQPIPDEWLDEGQSGSSKPSKPPRKTGLESDEDSELTELSDDGGTLEEAALTPAKGKRKANGIVSKSQPEDEQEQEHQEDEVPSDAHLADFVEWETICVTLQEWEHVAEQFENATHYTEKALYKTLMTDIVPFMVQELREIERKRELEEALQHRKRSSRLAIRESEKEQAIAAQRKRQEEDEKMSRSRRLEARQQKEEAERLKREAAREQRRQEREAREEARKNLTLQQEADKLAKIEKAEKAEKEKAEKAAKMKAAGSKPKSRTPSGQQENHSGRANGKKKNASNSNGVRGGEEWELDCEICHRKGKNLDDGTPMVSCGRCAKWQHIPCHELADRQVGRARRNWDSVDFICKACALAQLDRYRGYPPISQHAASYYNAPQTSSYSRSYGSSQTGQPPIDSRPAQQYIQPRDTAQQSFYMRPPTQNQQIGTHASSSHGAYSSSSSSHHAAGPPPQSPSLSFNHYQPPSHGYSGSVPQKDSYYSSSYSNSTQQPYPSYSHNQPYGHGSQHYRPPVPQPSSYSKPQDSPSAWNVTTPANAPGYSSNHNGVPSQSAPSAYRSTVAHDGHPDLVSLRESQHPASSSYARYSSGASSVPLAPETHYPSSASYNKHYPASSYPHQPQSQLPLDR